LIFLKYANHVFSNAAKELEGKSTGRRTISKIDYQDKGVLFLPEKARFSYLIGLPEGTDIGKAIDDAMRFIEEENEELKVSCPRMHTVASIIVLFSPYLRASICLLISKEMLLARSMSISLVNLP
jgi:type I restriction enzyme M protein